MDRVRKLNKLMVCLVSFLLLISRLLTPVAADGGATYYVAPNGQDSAPGTLDQPFATLQKAVDMAQAGDTVYVRGGVYHQTVVMKNSGTATHPIRLLAYENELPVLDGEYTLPTGNVDRCNNTVTPPRCFVSEPLVKLAGSYLEFVGFKLMRSQGVGIVLGGPTPVEHITIRNCLIHEMRNAAIRGQYVTYLLVDGCDISHAGNYAPYDRPGTELQWPPIVKAMHAEHLVYRNNVIHENWGEGLTAGVDSSDVLIEDNILYDNYAVQLYINRAQNVTIQRNLLYHTNQPDFRRGGEPSQCIVLNNEQVDGVDMTVEAIRVLNNVVVGCSRNFAIWKGESPTFSYKDITIAHNAFINAYANTPDGAYSLTIVEQIAVSNLQVQHNIILQNDGNIGSAPTAPSILFAHNLWSQTPRASMSGADDVVADPQLTNATAPLTPGAVQLEWYKPLPTSPAIEHNIGPFEFPSQPLTVCCTLYLPLTVRQ